jgi:hypothetical protein
MKLTISSFKKDGLIAENSSALGSYIPKGLTFEQQQLFVALKSIPQIKEGVDIKDPKFIILGKAKFIVTEDKDGVIDSQCQIFGVFKTQDKKEAGTIQQKIIKDVVETLKDYEWASKPALFYCEL